MLKGRVFNWQFLQRSRYNIRCAIKFFWRKGRCDVFARQVYLTLCLANIDRWHRVYRKFAIVMWKTKYRRILWKKERGTSSLFMYNAWATDARGFAATTAIIRYRMYPLQIEYFQLNCMSISFRPFWATFIPSNRLALGRLLFPSGEPSSIRLDR